MTASQRRPGPDDAMRELLAALVDPASGHGDALPRDTARTGEIPLTEGQRQLWFLQQLQPDATTYHVCAALRLHGPLRPDALDGAFADLAARHPALRTNILTALRGRPQGFTHPPGRTSPPELTELTGRPPERRDAEIQHAARELLAVPFDLGRDPLIRARLLRFAPDDHGLVLVLHHVVVDGWSLRILLRDLAARYSARVTGAPAELPELTHQYADFAHWQSTAMSGTARYQRALDYWRRTLADAPEESTAPPDPRGPGDIEQPGRTVHFDLPAAIVRQVTVLAAQQACTPFAVTFAAFTLWLARAARRTDLVVGVPSSGRPFPELDGVVGYFVNLLPVRSTVRPEATFAETVQAAHAGVAGALDHDLLPFDRIVKILGIRRSAGRPPLAQVAFQLVDDATVGGEADDWYGLAVEECRILHDDGARCDLELSLRRHGPEAIEGCLTYDTRRYRDSTAEQFRDDYLDLLAALCDHPDTPVGPLLDGGRPLTTAHED
ncbi:condensation domain-containing protein [Kitasatospora sp. RB6PN24]|uniref:condensation domain-containing protein n=1 Tax=Kitasatospora humi TaxID=2893891 RepID=UPI001E3DBFE4|nr:condensation domain-containing protein [Kitasatospora humi]MCC9308106.1 condensation domain-containing protein [Kitasatospora humi]